MQLVISTVPPILLHVRASRLRALAVTSSKCSSAIPEVPTVAESGLHGFESLQWWAMFAPKKTPTAIVNRLFVEVRKASENSRVKSTLAQEDLELAANGPRALAEFHRTEIAKWQKVIRDSNIILE